MSISALRQGVGGLQTGLNYMNRDAITIANVRTEADDLVSPLIDLHRHKNEALAATKVIKAADSALGTLLDIRV